MYACICVHVYVCMYVQVAAPLAVVALSICTIYVQWVAFLVAHVAALGHVVDGAAVADAAAVVVVAGVVVVVVAVGTGHGSGHLCSRLRKWTNAAPCATCVVAVAAAAALVVAVAAALLVVVVAFVVGGGAAAAAAVGYVLRANVLDSFCSSTVVEHELVLSY